MLHGSVASRLVRHVRSGDPICVTVTEVDGLVLARSAFETSMNYRSVVVLGTGREVTDPEERLAALRAISESVLPGRWDDVRPPNDIELRRTMVVAVAHRAVLGQGLHRAPGGPRGASGSCRCGRAGCRCAAPPATPEPSPDLRDGIEVPDYLAGMGRRPPLSDAAARRAGHDRASSSRNHEPTTGQPRPPLRVQRDRAVSQLGERWQLVAADRAGHATTHPGVERHTRAVAARRVPEPVDAPAVRQAVQGQRHLDHPRPGRPRCRSAAGAR